MDKWFIVNGMIGTNVDEDTFNNEFLKWVESKGWEFTGVISPDEEEKEGRE